MLQRERDVEVLMEGGDGGRATVGADVWALLSVWLFMADTHIHMCVTGQC